LHIHLASIPLQEISPRAVPAVFVEKNAHRPRHLPCFGIDEDQFNRVAWRAGPRHLRAHRVERGERFSDGCVLALDGRLTPAIGSSRLHHAVPRHPATSRSPRRASRSRGSAVILPLRTTMSSPPPLPWSPWRLLTDSWADRELAASGLYRVRRAGRDDVDYIGQTGGRLRGRLATLRGVYAREMPYRDPYTVAAALWAHWQFDGEEYEASTCPINGELGLRSTFDIYGVDVATGSLRWQKRTSDDGPTAAVVLDALALFNTESSTLLAVDVTNGDVVWEKWLGDPLLHPAAPCVSSGSFSILQS
jgi:hypothetical protein